MLVFLCVLCFLFLCCCSFFNLELSYHARDLLLAGAVQLELDEDAQPRKVGGKSYPHVHMHGLLGQTWKNAIYADGKRYQGTAQQHSSTCAKSDTCVMIMLLTVAAPDFVCVLCVCAVCRCGDRLSVGVSVLH